MSDGAAHTESNLRAFAPLDAAELESLLRRIAKARVAVIGDFCLDVYWMADLSRSEESLETGLPTRPIREQRCSPGGAGNVMANLLALGCRRAVALGAVGDDPWGRELQRLLLEMGADTEHLLVPRNDWATLTYVKPHVEKKETNRLDFGNFNALPDDAARELLARCRRVIPEVDVTIVNQQVRQGIHTPAFREGLAALLREFPGRCFVADCRHGTDRYAGAIVKINDHEAARLCGVERGREELVLREEALAAARALHARFGRPVVLTRGRRGVLVCDEAGACEIPAIQVVGPIDPVGAGDSVLAGLALGLAAGGDAATAAQVGNLAAGVTIRKLNQTGTASPEEILALARHADYVHRPELAEDPRRARRHGDTEIEVVTDAPRPRPLRVAIFDHDGTISVLREGWERVMEPMMIRAILGPRYDSADESLYLRATERVRSLIEQTTGIQTIVQMQGLADMVREFECVPPEEILDAAGYKRIYNDALMETVRRRIAKLRRGELDAGDFLIKNAKALILRLRAAGVRLYLASGTDRDDVRAEAEAMGYADCFDGGIHGSVGDVARDAKREVLDRILRDIGGGAASGLAAFGDGPVEIRETKRRGGYTVGVASDEVRRFGLNPVKRTRLIQAGADLVVPDFSQLDALLDWLGLPAGVRARGRRTARPAAPARRARRRKGGRP